MNSIFSFILEAMVWAIIIVGVAKLIGSLITKLQNYFGKNFGKK